MHSILDEYFSPSNLIIAGLAIISLIVILDVYFLRVVKAIFWTACFFVGATLLGAVYFRIFEAHVFGLYVTFILTASLLLVMALTPWRKVANWVGTCIFLLWVGLCFAGGLAILLCVAFLNIFVRPFIPAATAAKPPVV